MTDASIQTYQQMYDRMAPFYAGAMRFLPVWRRYAETVIPWLETFPSTAAILELGPGPGVLFTQLAGRFHETVGLDLSTGMLRRAQDRLHTMGLPSRLVQGTATALPFAVNSFDVIVLTFTFSAIPGGQTAMDEMARVLRPAGLVALVDAGIPDDGNPIGVGLARLWELFDDTMRDEASLMHQAGLVVLERREFGAFSSIRLVVGQKPTG